METRTEIGRDLPPVASRSSKNWFPCATNSHGPTGCSRSCRSSRACKSGKRRSKEASSPVKERNFLCPVAGAEAPPPERATASFDENF